MTLSSKPLKHIKHPDPKEEALSKALYHFHRGIEWLHKLEKLIHKYEANNSFNHFTTSGN